MCRLYEYHFKKQDFWFGGDHSKSRIFTELALQGLTHLDWDDMATILQACILNLIFLNEIFYCFFFKCHWHSFPKLMCYVINGSDIGLTPKWRKAVIWTNYSLGDWRIYVYLCISSSFSEAGRKFLEMRPVLSLCGLRFVTFGWRFAL